MTIPNGLPRRLPGTQAEWDQELNHARKKVREARHDVSRLVSAVSELVARATVKLNEAENDLAALTVVDRAGLPHDTA